MHAGYWLARFALCPADFHFMARELQSPLGVYNPPTPPTAVAHHVIALAGLSFTMILVGILSCTSQFTTASHPPIRTLPPLPTHCCPWFPAAMSQSNSAHHDIKPQSGAGARLGICEWMKLVSEGRSRANSHSYFLNSFTHTHTHTFTECLLDVVTL